MARIRGVVNADPTDDRITVSTAMRIRPEMLTRIKELAAMHNRSQALTVGDLVERGLKEEAQA